MSLIKEDLELRDYFASAIMQGFCAKYGLPSRTEVEIERARTAYSIADAMLVVRNATR